MKKTTVEFPKYSKSDGFKFHWIDNFEISTKIENEEIVIQANREGLVSLAGHLLNLAQTDVPNGYHIHLDDINAFDAGSIGFIVEKKI